MRFIDIENIVFVLLGKGLYSKVVLILRWSQSEISLYMYAVIHCVEPRVVLS